MSQASKIPATPSPFPPEIELDLYLIHSSPLLNMLLLLSVRKGQTTYSQLSVFLNLFPLSALHEWYLKQVHFVQPVWLCSHFPRSSKSAVFLLNRNPVELFVNLLKSTKDRSRSFKRIWVGMLELNLSSVIIKIVDNCSVQFLSYPKLVNISAFG